MSQPVLWYFVTVTLVNEYNSFSDFSYFCWKDFYVSILRVLYHFCFMIFHLSLVFNCLRNDVSRCGSLQLYPVWGSWNYRIFKFKLLTKFWKFGLLFLQILFFCSLFSPFFNNYTYINLLKLFHISKRLCWFFPVV